MISSLKQFFVGAAVVALVAGPPGAAFAEQINLIKNGDFTDITPGNSKKAGRYPGEDATNLNSSYNGKTVAQQEAFNTAMDGSVTVRHWSTTQQSNNNRPVYVTRPGATHVTPVWTTTTEADLPTVGVDGLAYNGGAMSLDGDPTYRSWMWQGVNVEVGKTYHLSFLYAYGQQNGTPGVMTNMYGRVQWGGEVDSSGLKNGTRFNTTQMTVPSKGWRGWYTFEADVVATAATQLLGFTAYGPGVPPVFLVADVSLYDTTNPPPTPVDPPPTPVDPPETVPEPSTLAIAGTGLVIAGIASLRRRARGKVEAV